MGRSPCCDKSKVKRGSWSPEEDATLKNYLHKHGTGGNWISLPQKAGLQRCGKSCRLRWLNYLRPNIKHGGFTQDEEYTICNLYNKIGSRWSVIASHLPGRTDNDVKNYWNTKLKKKLMSNPSATIAASTTAAASTTTSETTSFQGPTNLLALQDCCLPQSVSYEPINYSFPKFIFDDFSSANDSFSFCPPNQDSSFFGSFSEKNGVKKDEVVSGIWSKEEALEADSNADLFSILYLHSKSQGVSQSY